jgi:hypothetical protein
MFEGEIRENVACLLTYSMEQGPSCEANQSLQLVKYLPAVYRTQRFITALSSARHLSLS